MTDLRARGLVDAVFASAFLGLLAVLWWPRVGWAGAALPVVAFGSVGDRAFWPRLRGTVVAASLLVWAGGALMLWAGAEPVTRPALVLGCALLVVWARRDRLRAIGG